MKQFKNFRRVFYSTKEGIGIWYLLPCQEREEQKILTICQEKLPKRTVDDVFVLTFDRMRRYEGVWHLEQQLLFPGYVFLESKNEEIISEELERSSIAFGKKNHLLRMSLEEEEFLKGLCGVKHHLEMSRGIIRKGSTLITEGPLKGIEKRISRIDRHKRLARIEIRMKPDYRYIPAGLEITEKIG